MFLKSGQGLRVNLLPLETLGWAGSAMQAHTGICFSWAEQKQDTWLLQVLSLLGAPQSPCQGRTFLLSTGGALTLGLSGSIGSYGLGGGGAQPTCELRKSNCRVQRLRAH